MVNGELRKLRLEKQRLKKLAMQQKKRLLIQQRKLQEAQKIKREIRELRAELSPALRKAKSIVSTIKSPQTRAKVVKTKSVLKKGFNKLQRFAEKYG